MREYNFTSDFELPHFNIAPDVCVDSLHEVGCDGALVGIGRKGYVSLDFWREATSATEAISSAIENVKAAIP